MSLDLDYEPKVLVNTCGMAESEWLSYRRKGIGGSDVAAISNCSPFKTMRDVYYEKIGLQPLKPHSNWVQMEVGHRLEDLVAKIFEKRTGYFISRDYRMFLHPYYPFMLANIDFLFIDNNGEMGILECKTASSYSKDKWEDDKIPFHYELQVRHYMAVLNLNTAWIACLCGNSENDFVMRKITRDLDLEKDMIDCEDFYWNTFVIPKHEPPFVEKADLGENCLKQYFRPQKGSPALELPTSSVAAVQDYLKLQLEKARLNKCIAEVEEQMKAITLPLIDLFKNKSVAFCRSKNDCYEINYKTQYRQSIPKEKLYLLKKEYPDIYSQYVSETSFSVLRLKTIK